MRRRELLFLVGAITAARPLRAQQTTMPVIGFLTSIAASSSYLDDLRQGLAEEGYVEGRNVRIEPRGAEGQYDRLPALAAELVARPVDVIVASGGTVSLRAAKAATDRIPIVALIGADPVAFGLVDSLARPGGNVTGVAQLVVEAEGKRLQLLHELVPAAATIAYLENPNLPNIQAVVRIVEAAARDLGVGVSILQASTESDLAPAFAAASQQRVPALLVGSDPFFFSRRRDLVGLAAQHRVPTMYFFREFVTAGGLISYGTSLAEGFRQVGRYAGRILKGAKPADLPIAQQSEKIELIINLETAKALSLPIPPAILARADDVVE
jgi:putative ABC transport system substrate-binding protein